MKKNDFLRTQRIRQLFVKTNLKSTQICRQFAKFWPPPPPPPTSSTEFPPLYMCCNIHHFGITKRKVMASKLQVTPTKLQVTRSKFTSLTADTNEFQLTNTLFVKPGFHYDVNASLCKRNLWCDISVSVKNATLWYFLCHIKGSAFLCLRLRRNENQA